MVAFVRHDATFLPVKEKPPALFGICNKVGVGGFFGGLVYKPNFLRNHHIFHLFFEYIQDLARLAAQYIAVDVKQVASIPVVVVHKTDRIPLIHAGRLGSGR